MKKKVCISIDENTLALAKLKIDSPLSPWIENQLNFALQIDDEESELMKKIQENENENNVLKDKLCKIRSMKRKEREQQVLIQTPQKRCDEIVSRKGEIGKNRIKFLATNFDVSFEDLLTYCVNNKYEIINYQD